MRFPLPLFLCSWASISYPLYRLSGTLKGELWGPPILETWSRDLPDPGIDEREDGRGFYCYCYCLLITGFEK